MRFSTKFLLNHIIFYNNNEYFLCYIIILININSIINSFDERIEIKIDNFYLQIFYFVIEFLYNLLNKLKKEIDLKVY